VESTRTYFQDYLKNLQQNHFKEQDWGCLYAKVLSKLIMGKYGLKIMQRLVKVKELHSTLLYQSSKAARSDNKK
jgi:hypothetical protein